MTEVRDAKVKIRDFLQRVGRATLREIAAHLGEEWQEPKKNVLLRQIVARMEKRGIIEKLAYGVYGPGLDKHRRYIDARDYNETRIANYLRERGGHAETGAIHDATGHRDLRRGARDPWHQAVTKTLKTSPRFHQQLGRGVWHLSRDEIAELPLTGYWAGRWTEFDWDHGERGGFDSWESRRDAFFATVGCACRTAREVSDLTLEEVARDPDVGATLGSMALRCPKVKLDCFREIEAEVERDFARQGLTDMARVDSEARERRDELPLYLLLRFEEGEPALHLAAPIEFYRALARLYGVSAGKLTRGEIVAEPREDKFLEPTPTFLERL